MIQRMNLPTIKTPCVGVCTTALGDDVCRGCKRYSHEVIDWNSYNNEQKLAIETRLVRLLTTIIQNKLFIVDEKKLQWQLDNQPVVNLPTHRNLYCQAFSRSEEHTSELQSRPHLVCRLLLEKKKRASGRRDAGGEIGRAPG